MSRLLLALALATVVAAAAAAASAPRSSASTAGRCTATTDFDLYAIPSGDEHAAKDVFVKGVPRTARHIGARFLLVADGRPVGTSAFPFQTWATKVKGFRRDGLLWVQITLSGYGYGMPVARLSRWRAVVSYDCDRAVRGITAR